MLTSHTSSQAGPRQRLRRVTSLDDGSRTNSSRTNMIRVVGAAAAANIGGLLVGLQLALFSGILEMPSFHTAMSPWPVGPPAKSLITSALVFGAIAGAFPAGPVCDRAGRRPALLLTAALFAMATFVMACASAVSHVVVGRLIAGLAYAVANVVCPMYSAELAPPQLRGVIVNFYQLSITIGIFLAQLLNWQYWDSASWNSPLLIAVLPAAVMAITVFLGVPESPSWLMAKGRPAEARSAAYWLRIPQPEDISAGVDAEAGEGEVSKIDSSGSLTAMISDKSARRRLLIGAGIGAAQQCTGINAVIFFGPALVADVLRMSGSSAPFRAAAVVGFGNFIATVLSMFVIERYGRRKLLLAAGPPMVVSLITLGLMRDGAIGRSDLAGIGALLTFIVSFAITYGPLTFLVQSEVFPVQYKGVAMSTCSMVMSIFALIIAATFLPLLEVLGGGIYFVYAACVVASTIFVYLLVPETRNMSLKDIDEMLSS